MILSPDQRKEAEEIAQTWELVERYRLRHPAKWYPPHPGQLAFHKAPHTVRAMFPGNGFGKTGFGIAALAGY